MIDGEAKAGRPSVIHLGLGLMVFGVLLFSAVALLACGGPASPAVSTVAPAAPKAATQAVATAAAIAPTAAAAATVAAPTVAAVAPTVAAAATAGAPTVSAAGTALAPTVSAAGTALAPTAAAGEPTAVALATKAAPTISAQATMIAPTAVAAATAAAASGSGATTTTAGQLADAGQGVYASSCGCHGPQGEGRVGPALIGPNANYSHFKNAQELLTFISVVMPANHPGSLSPDQAAQVTAYLLVQNNIVQRSASLGAANFGGISLSR